MLVCLTRLLRLSTVLTGIAAALLLFLAAAPASANQGVFLIARATGASPASDDVPRVAEFSLYIDPLKTNWMAWSQLSQLPLVAGNKVIDGDLGGPAIANGFMRVSVVSPWGQRSPIATFGRHDDQGNPLGQQAVLYGGVGQTPRVVRRDSRGGRLDLVEAGPLDDFIQRGGPGYYTFQVLYVTPQDAPPVHGDIYLAVDTVEGVIPNPPIIFTHRPSLLGTIENLGGGNVGGGFGSLSIPTGNNNDHHGHNNNPNEPVFPTPTPTPIPTPPPPPEPTFVDGRIPVLPTPDEEISTPVVPEPATLALIGLGLAGGAALRRRRSR